MTRHITHRTDVLGFAIGQLLFKCGELRVKYADVAVNVLDVFLYVVDVLLTFVNLTIDDHQLLQPFLHVGLIGFKGSLLLLYLLL